MFRSQQHEKRYLVGVVILGICILIWPPYMSELGVSREEKDQLLKFLFLQCLMMVSNGPVALLELLSLILHYFHSRKPLFFAPYPLEIHLTRTLSGGKKSRNLSIRCLNVV